jgi:hypothetical protein
VDFGACGRLVKTEFLELLGLGYLGPVKLRFEVRSWLGWGMIMAKLWWPEWIMKLLRNVNNINLVARMGVAPTVSRE